METHIIGRVNTYNITRYEHLLYEANNVPSGLLYTLIDIEIDVDTNLSKLIISSNAESIVRVYKNETPLIVARISALNRTQTLDLGLSIVTGDHFIVKVGHNYSVGMNFEATLLRIKP